MTAESKARREKHNTNWGLLIILLATAIVAYAFGLGATAPADVLKEVRQLHIDVNELKEDVDRLSERLGDQ